MLCHRRMIIFFGRLLGALALNPAAYEDIERDRGSALQSMIVVATVCAAGGIGAMGVGLVGVSGFVTGTVVMLGAWLVWVAAIATIGTISLAEPQTRSNPAELLRVLGFAAAPGMIVALAAVRPVAILVVSIAVVWMTAAAVLAVRQALDYRSTGRAAAVCVIAAALSLAIMAGVAMLLSERVA